MIAKVWSAGVKGVDGFPVSVELDLANGLPTYATVGLPDSAVRESRERVVSALRNSGYDFPPRRVTVNLAPAELRKRGTQYDLPVGLGVLAASGQVPAGDWMERYCFFGELALDGRVRPVSGVLSMAAAALAGGAAGVVVARENAAEAAAVGIPSFGVGSLAEAARFVAGGKSLVPADPPSVRVDGAPCDLADVRGQGLARRALEVAAAGGHNLLFTGTPGAGKSMLARRLPGLLPPLGKAQALECAKLLSVAGLLPPGRWPAERPFRAPHHSCSSVSLLGGGHPLRPGEASLAHAGVLFLDELPEFPRDALEALRVPLETRVATVSRARDVVEFPADFQLVAARNPCPCGWQGHPVRACACTPGQVARYRGRVSGPLLDRFDLRVEVAPLPFEQWEPAAPASEASAAVRARVTAARERQEARLGPGRTNASMDARETRRFCAYEPGGRGVLEAAASRLALSARSLERLLKTARTLADLEDAPRISRTHLLEAVMLSGQEAATA